MPLAACDNTSNRRPPSDAGPGAADHPVVKDASGATDAVVDAGGGSQCKWPTALDDGGVVGCVPARAFVTCTLPGSSASYPASDPMGCLDCSGTCDDSCALGEFALSCKAPLSLGSSALTGGCHQAFTFASGPVVYCCPCR
ncbi:MAG TPA: hypothetical protein VMT03_00260 [Polyangia bacterium]|nr:hypothetical protein [Polyangia bacterium]